MRRMNGHELALVSGGDNPGMGPYEAPNPSGGSGSSGGSGGSSSGASATYCENVSTVLFGDSIQWCISITFRK